MNTQIIAIANQKGGVGKTTTCANLGIGLAQAGKKVLLIDGDPQGSLTISLGHPQPDKLPFTLSDVMGRILMDEPVRLGEGILHHPEGVDLMPADIQLSGMEVSLVNAMSRETILRQYLDTLKGQYSHILIDCQPSLGMLTVNALAAANRVIIPVQAEYLPAKGLEQLLSTVNKVKRQINPKLQIDGILLTMVDSRTNFAKEISALLRENYGSKIKVFGTEIPHSVRAKEISAEGKSIFAHDPGGKVAEGYDELELDTLGDRKTALFLIMSDTDDSFNFLISMCYTQLFNLLCEKADDVYGGRLPVHVRCLIDECANIGQIPKLEKLVATIRSREISACLVLQAQSQLKAIYKDNADTIIGNMDTSIFLGGKEPTTLKELAAVLGKETIDTYNTGESRGRETSHSLNYQKLGKELMSQDELAVMDGGKCILQLRGVRPFLSDKYDITKHPNFKYTADADDKNAFDIEAFLSARLKLKPNEVCDVYEVDTKGA